MPKISARLAITLILIAVLQSGCGIMDIINLIDDNTERATYDMASYKLSADEDCTGETYENDTCAEAVNPFPDTFILALTDASKGIESLYYSIHNGSVFRINNTSDELLYETDILRDMNDDKDYGFKIEQGGYTCTSIINYSNIDPTSDDTNRYFNGRYVTTNCVNSDDAEVSCHLCYNLSETLNNNSSQQNL